MQLFDQIPWPVVIIACATLGFAPFFPEPHVWEKLRMLFAGQLVKPVDIFDFLMHAAPFLVLIAKVVRAVGKTA